MPKSIHRGGLLALLVCLAGFSVSCGDLYRPIVQQEPPPGGDPQQQRQAMVVSFNNGGQGSAMHVNASGDTVVAARMVGSGPVHAALAPFLNAAYVANQASDNVSIYNPLATTTNVETASLPSGSAPSYVLYTDGTVVYVANTGANTVGVLNASARAFTDLIPVGPGPVALVDTPDRSKIFTANSTGDSVSVISVAQKAVVNTLSLNAGSHPVWLTMTPLGRLFVVNQGNGTVSVIDTASDAVTSTIPVGTSPRMAVYDSRLRRVYVVNSGSDSITAIDADTLAVVRTVSVGSSPQCLTALANGSRVYVANAGSDDVSVVDANSLEVRQTIPVGDNPVWIDSSGDSTKVFVANRGSSSISDIRTQNDTVITTLNSTSPEPVFVQVQPR